MGQTQDFQEFIESQAALSGPGTARIRLFGGVLQQSIDGGAWSTIGGAGGLGTVTSVAATAGGLLVVAGTPTVAPTVGIDAIAANTVIGNATGGSAVPTALTKAQMQTLLGTCLYDLVPAADLTDADQTVQPATDKASLYTIPATVTGTHIYTFGNTGATALRESFYVVNKSSFSQTIKNAAGTTVGTLPAASGNVFYAINLFFLTNQILNVTYFFKSP